MLSSLSPFFCKSATTCVLVLFNGCLTSIPVYIITIRFLSLKCQYFLDHPYITLLCSVRIIFFVYILYFFPDSRTSKNKTSSVPFHLSSAGGLYFMILMFLPNCPASLPPLSCLFRPSNNSSVSLMSFGSVWGWPSSSSSPRFFVGQFSAFFSSYIVLYLVV